MEIKSLYVLAITFLANICLSQEYTAVVELDALGISENEAKALTDRLRVELHKSGNFIVLERAMMEEILTEQGFQQSGCVSDECIVEVGKLLAVQSIIGGSLSRVGSTYSVSIRMISVETGKVFAVSQKDFSDKIDYLLTDGMAILVKDLITSLGAKQLRQLTTSKTPLQNYGSIISELTLSLKSIDNKSIHPVLGIWFGYYMNKNLMSFGLKRYLIGGDETTQSADIQYRRYFPELSIPLPTLKSVKIIIPFGLINYEYMTIRQYNVDEVGDSYSYYYSLLNIGFGLTIDITSEDAINTGFNFNILTFPRGLESNYAGILFNFGIAFTKFPIPKQLHPVNQM